MPDTRHNDTDWNCGVTATVDLAQLAVLQDIRDELKQLNRIFGCQNFLELPRMVRKVAASVDRTDKRLAKETKLR